MSHQDPLETRPDILSNEYLMRPKDVEQAQAQLMEMAKEEEFRRKLSATFSNDDGFEVLEWILEALRMHQTAFTGNAYTNYNCALKDFAGMLHDLVLHSNPILAFRLVKSRYERSRYQELDMRAQLEKLIEEEKYK
jgi:hypothetical protein